MGVLEVRAPLQSIHGDRQLRLRGVADGSLAHFLGLPEIIPPLAGIHLGILS